MSDKDEKLLGLQGFSPERDIRLSVREPTETQIARLWKRLAQSHYDKPILMEDRETRSLYFSIDGCVQSEMRLDEPESLINAYTRKMMGFLLFRKRPREVVMIGLGGGSLAKFCHRHLPSTRMTVVEINAAVIALRSHFQIPPDDSRLRIIHGDGSAYVAAMVRSNQSTDVLLVDAFDRQGIATAVTERSFLQDARRVLSRHGIFVMNHVAEHGEYHIEEIRLVFGGPVIAVPVNNGGNMVVFAGACTAKSPTPNCRNSQCATCRSATRFAIPHAVATNTRIPEPVALTRPRRGVTPVTVCLHDSADVFTPGCSDAHGRGGAQDAAVRWAPRPEDSRWGNSTSFKHETLILSDVERDIWARAGASRSPWFARW